MSQGSASERFDILEATIDAIHQAYRTRRLTATALVQGYLDRIAAYDKRGPAINAIITANASAIDDAERLDKSFAATGLSGPLHGIPIVIKDQIDAKGLPTTLGAVPLKDYFPDRDAFVVDRLRKAGAIVLAKTTLGELGGGDTHGTLFGSTRNPYALDRTAGGSSGGSGAAISANLGAVGLGQEGFSSIRRPSGWNGIVGMRASGGLVSRAGSAGGWPGIAGSLGPMTRTVRDAALILDAIIGYDPEDPLSACGVGRVSSSLAAGLDAASLRGARIGVMRESIGVYSEPETDDFRKVSAVFDRAIADLQRAGAVLVDPIAIPDVRALLATRTASDRGGMEAGWAAYYGRSASRPFASARELLDLPGYKPRGAIRDVTPPPSHEQVLAGEQLMFNFLKVMADHRLDAIVHKTVEHQPTLIEDGVNRGLSGKGVIHLNTFMCYTPSITVPAGFSADNLPAGLTFLGRPYTDGQMLSYAFAYEQATKHRRPPASVPAL